MKIVLGLLALLVSLPLAIAGYSYAIEPNWIETTHLEIPISGLPREFDGLRVVQISDLHVGPYASKEDVERVVAAVNRLKPDVVAITGDFVSLSAENIYPCAEALEKLSPRMGTYGILGNHDFATDPDAIAEALRSVGISVLRNQADHLTIGSQRLWIVGVDDVYLFQDDLPGAMADVPPGDKSILLCHSPDIVEQAIEMPIDLILVGHTHGGQVRLPIFGAPVLPVHNPQYEAGLFAVGQSLMYVNRGLGVVYPPVRFMSRPEITVITLRAQ